MIHLALGAVINALWDLWAKVLGKPVWRVIADMTPEEVVRCIDFRYITDALTPEEAIALLKEVEPTKAERIKDAEQNRAVPAYTTSAGWLGYSEEKLRALLDESVKAGFKHFKLKVGGNLEDDKRRLAIAREVIGYDKGNVLMVDANQVRRLSFLREAHEGSLIDLDIGLVCSRSNQLYERTSAVQAMVHRGTNFPGRCPGPCRDPQSTLRYTTWPYWRSDW